MDEKTAKKNLQELSDLRAEIEKKIQQFNIKASKAKYNTRMAYLTAEVEEYSIDKYVEREIDPSLEENSEGYKKAFAEAKAEFDPEKFLRESDEYLYAQISAPNAYAWFPSQICEG